MHQALPAFAATSGPRSAKIAIIGEAWGQSESELRKPFVGESGKLLFEMLGDAMPEVAPDLHREVREQFKYGLAWTRKREEWLTESSIFLTNVLALRPPGNKIPELCENKKGVEALNGGTYLLPAIESPGKYLRPEFLPELTRLREELEIVRPNLIVLAGAKASWALLGVSNIGQIRGTISASAEGYKCLPTYHPAGVMRMWGWRVIVVADLMKALRESASPEIKRPDRAIFIDPTIEELESWTSRVLQSPPAFLSCDTETRGGQITCIGFAPSRSEAMVVPFVDPARAGQCYWTTSQEEERAWSCVARLLEEPKIAKIFQNGLYDLQYILPLGIRVANCTEDTMLLHHSILPEMKKGLGFLGSVYTNEPSWKLMRLQKADTEKRDE